MSTHLMRTLTRGLLAAMLLAVLAPGVSRAVASTRVAGDWVEVCSAEGMQWVQLAAQKPRTEPDHPADLPHVLDPCGHCALATDRFAPLLPSPIVVAPGDRFWAYQARPTVSLHALSAPSPGARGPPLLS